MTYTEEGKRHIQSFGEQHPDFHSKEMKEYRAKGKSHAKKKELAKKIKTTDWAKHNQETGGKSVKGFEKYTG